MFSTFNFFFDFLIQILTILFYSVRALGGGRCGTAYGLVRSGVGLVLAFLSNWNVIGILKFFVTLLPAFGFYLLKALIGMVSWRLGFNWACVLDRVCWIWVWSVFWFHMVWGNVENVVGLERKQCYKLSLNDDCEKEILIGHENSQVEDRFTPNVLPIPDNNYDKLRTPDPGIQNDAPIAQNLNVYSIDELCTQLNKLKVTEANTPEDRAKLNPPCGDSYEGKFSTIIAHDQRIEDLCKQLSKFKVTEPKTPDDSAEICRAKLNNLYGGVNEEEKSPKSTLLLDVHSSFKKKKNQPSPNIPTCLQLKKNEWKENPAVKTWLEKRSPPNPIKKNKHVDPFKTPPNSNCKNSQNPSSANKSENKRKSTPSPCTRNSPECPTLERRRTIQPSAYKAWMENRMPPRDKKDQPKDWFAVPKRNKGKGKGALA